MNEIDEKIKRLSEGWGAVYMAYYPHDDADIPPDCIVRNHTDEGLGADEWKEASGETFSEALDKALSTL